MKPIVVGSIVKYKEGWVRVSRLTKTSCNLCGIFNGIIYHKNIPLTEVKEDEAAWYEQWSQSETYQSM